MVRAMEVVVVEEEVKASGALVGVGIGVGVSPLAEGGLDEALGLAVGLWGVGPGEAVLEAEGGEGGGGTARRAPLRRLAVEAQQVVHGQAEA